MSEETLKQHPVKVEVQDEATGEVVEQVAGYRLDTELSIYDLEKPVRCVVEWDGNPRSKKMARLVIGVGRDEMDKEAVVDGLRFRQRVEIMLKLLQRRVNWPAFGGGKAILRPSALEKPDEEERKRLLRNQRQVTTQLANLERETILKRLLSQRGEFVRHKTKRIILVVADHFEDRRMQLAYERYCLILNHRDIRVPLDDGEPWRLLFTYHLDAPSSSAQFK